jgi:hypothetical protein
MRSRRHRRLLVVALWAIGALVIAPVPGQLDGPVSAARASGGVAAIYPIPAPELSTDKSTYEPNGSGVVRLDGFNGCPSVTIVIEGVPGSVTAAPDENGTVTVDVTMPSEPGEHTITATCSVGDQSASGTIVVTDPGTNTVPTDPSIPTTTPADGRLPSTGSDAGRSVQVGLVLLASGAGFVLATRSRRRRAHH